MEKKNHSGNNFVVGTANRQDVASLLGVRCQDKERRVFCFHSTCVFDYECSGKRENCSIQTLIGANCTEAKIRIWYNSCTLSISLLFFPRLEQYRYPYICLFVCLFVFCAESNTFYTLRSVTQLNGLPLFRLPCGKLSA